MPWWLLLLIVLLTWCLWAFAAAIGKAAAEARAGVAKEKRGGVSLVPVIPLFPLVLFGVAKVADIFVGPWGTRIVAILHLLLALCFLISIVRDWHRLRCQPRSK